MKILQIKKITGEVIAAFQKLIPQLDNTVPLPTKEKLIRTISSPTTYLFVANHQDKIVGSIILIIYTSATGDYAHLGDLVVDKKMRGMGFGSRLIKTALNLAKEKDIDMVDLTSRPHRKTANQLYEKIGFVKRDTNVYRYIL